MTITEYEIANGLQRGMATAAMTWQQAAEFEASIAPLPFPGVWQPPTTAEVAAIKEAQVVAETAIIVYEIANNLQPGMATAGKTPEQVAELVSSLPPPNTFVVETVQEAKAAELTSLGTQNVVAQAQEIVEQTAIAELAIAENNMPVVQTSAIQIQDAAWEIAVALPNTPVAVTTAKIASAAASVSLAVAMTKESSEQLPILRAFSAPW